MSRGDYICHQQELTIETRPRALCDITEQVARVVAQAGGVRTGLCTVFVRHTSASLVIQENADPAVQRDLARWMAQLAPESEAWEHAAEGADDMPSHLRASVTRSAESIPVRDGRLALGTWQGLYLWEHRAHAHRRQLVVHVAGLAG